MMQEPCKMNNTVTSLLFRKSTHKHEHSTSILLMSRINHKCTRYYKPLKTILLFPSATLSAKYYKDMYIHESNVEESSLISLSMKTTSPWTSTSIAYK
ncbi:hypothetical protein V1477_016628 [Vespula maculifrons]|uniref:Uncharacterized protein n=1 Tax=Vespula maculifrons TaxID=7453 RepID=A0ABD2B8S8_VESMC